MGKKKDAAAVLAAPPYPRPALELRLGEHAGLGVTSAGLLSIGGLVSSVLLSTAVIVWVATRSPAAQRRTLVRAV